MTILSPVRLGSFLMLGLGSGAAVASPTPDAWITTKAKIALVTANSISSSAVHIDTIDGNVTLYGKVTSEQQKERAETIAKGIDGAKHVRNLLQVVAASSEKAVDEADARIKERVQKVLKSDGSLARSKISVKSVNKGAVLLAGKTKDLSDHLWALESVAAVTGVRSVASEVKSAHEQWDFEKARVVAGTKDAALDSWITTSTKMKLLADGQVPALDVSVDTYRGVVTLFGMVPTAAAKAAAAADAGRVESVVSVNDELQVVPAARQDAVQAQDDLIERDVKLALSARPELEHVSVTVKNGVAHLTGNIGSGWERLHAATVARSVAGVRSVDDDLHLDRPRG